MRLLNSLTYKDKDYSIDDVVSFIPNEDKGVEEGFYGGRVTQLGVTKEKGVYLCMEKMDPIDILVEEIPFSDEPIDLNTLTNKELVAMLEETGIEVPARATKPELIALFE